MDLRNIAIIAHVDHGKTTLVDELLKQSGAFRANQQVIERAMDSNDLERERGITILAKCTSVEWNGHRINIVDTPGHADFGGEVERILSMVDGVVLLVDAAEGPMPQTKFVTSKALALGLRPIVVLNKVDRPDAEPDRALDECFDLFANLGADDDQLDFPSLYASGRSGWADTQLDGPRDNLDALFGLILTHVPAPKQIALASEPFRMLVTTLGADPFIGRILTGRVESGRLKTGETVQALSRDGSQIESFRVTKILAFRGLTKQPIDWAEAGDIVTLAGMSKATVADTICAPSVSEPIPAQPIDPPTISVTFGINDSPLAGRDGRHVQSRVIRERLMKEAESNVAIHVSDTPGGDAFDVAGRGELQMGVLIENMRREGFELSISRPQVLFREIDGTRHEPIEEITIDVDEEYSGVVIEKLTGPRRGELVEMKPAGTGKTRVIAHVPSRGLIGYHGEFLTDTRGTGVLNRGVSRLGTPQGPHSGPPRGRSDLDGKRHVRGLRAVELGGARQDVHWRAGTGISGHDYRRAQPRKRSGSEPAQGQETDQRARQRHRRGGAPDHTRAPHAGTGHRLYRHRRIGRGHAARDPLAQALPRSPRTQTASPCNDQRIAQPDYKNHYTSPQHNHAF